jgi:lipid-A-disaccharide synthase
MLIAGEASGDALAAELVEALRDEMAAAAPLPTHDHQPLQTSLAPRFFGAGGPRMAAAGVDIAFDLTSHSVFGAAAVVRNYLTFRRLFGQVFRLALERKPDVIIGVDFNTFNLRFARAIRNYTRKRAGWFHDWRPKIIKYVSPQVWASRGGRARGIARDFDLLISTIPFEKDWYRRRVPRLPVEFIGNPIVDRYRSVVRPPPKSDPGNEDAGSKSTRSPALLLLPGSRAGELKRHLPVMFGALAIIRRSLPDVSVRMVLPRESLLAKVKAAGLPAGVEVQVGGLQDSMASADLAIGKTGTVALECAYFGVPMVAFYKTDWFTYTIGRQIVTVKYAAMPNLLAGEEIIPEYIQHAATPENLARSALELLCDSTKREEIKTRFANVVAQLGSPGASRRAARAILQAAAARATEF